MKTSEIVAHLRVQGWEVHGNDVYGVVAKKGGMRIFCYSRSALEFRVGHLCVWTANVRTVNGVDAAIKRALQEIRKVELPDVRKQAVMLANVLEAFNVKPL